MTEQIACFPLSLSQAGMWLALQMTPGSAAYNVPSLISLRGPVRTELLASALRELIARHEILRTVFVVQEEEVVQVVLDDLPLPYWEYDVRHSSDPSTAAEQFAISESQRAFDLTQGPLLRVWLVRLAEDHYYLVLVMHHIICDGWSMEVLLRELSELYSAAYENRSHHLQPLPIHYADFAVWQRQWLQGQTLSELCDYWQQTLVGAPALHALPTDRPRPPISSLHGAHYHFDFPFALARDLVALGQSEECTLFMTLLAALQVTLSLLTTQNDVVVGSPMANRTQAEVQNLIGLFTNMLPLRMRFAPDLTWRQLLRQVRTTTLSAYAHQGLPFEELVKVARPPRIAGASPFFQVTFSLQQHEHETLCLPGVSVKTLELQNGTSKFDLTLHMRLTSEQFTGTYVYSTDLFDLATIEYIAQGMQAVVQHMCANPDALLTTVSLPIQKRSAESPTASPPEPSPPAGAPAPQQAALEQIILGIWQDVLGFTDVGVQDNFFDLGGYSFLMIQIQRQLQDTLGVHISLPDLFRVPTVQAMTQFILCGFDEVPALLERRERGQARSEALNQQRTRRQRSRQGGSHV